VKLHPRLIALAVKCATAAQCNIRLGAVVARKNIPISFGWNKPFKTHPRSRSRFQSIHAELDAILGATIEQTNGATLYVVRLLRNGRLAHSRPCEDCMRLIHQAQIRTVVFVNDKGELTHERIDGSIRTFERIQARP